MCHLIILWDIIFKDFNFTCLSNIKYKLLSAAETRGNTLHYLFIKVVQITDNILLYIFFILTMIKDSVINDIEVCNTIHEEKIEKRRKNDKNVYFYFNVCILLWTLRIWLRHFTVRYILYPHIKRLSFIYYKHHIITTHNNSIKPS